MVKNVRFGPPNNSKWSANSLGSRAHSGFQAHLTKPTKLTHIRNVMVVSGTIGFSDAGFRAVTGSGSHWPGLSKGRKAGAEGEPERVNDVVHRSALNIRRRKGFRQPIKRAEIEVHNVNKRKRPIAQLNRARWTGRGSAASSA
jgi:hypothetical protein